jgi:molybdenum cofactor cytidylyltransferase
MTDVKMIVLAAGLSTRMGRQKLLLPFGGSTVVETVLGNVHEAGFSRVCAVFSKVTAAKIAAPEWLQILVNEAPERGQSSSMLIGLDSLAEGEDFCLMLGDLPLAQPRDLALLAETFRKLPAGKTVLTPSREGRFGHPMFYRSIWKERFRSASGDVGGRKILSRYEDEIVRVEAPDGHFRDLDTPEDYKSLLASR